MLDYKPITTLVHAGSLLSIIEALLSQDPFLHWSIAGNLKYLTLTSSGIAHAVNQVCQYMHRLHIAL